MKDLRYLELVESLIRQRKTGGKGGGGGGGMDRSKSAASVGGGGAPSSAGGGAASANTEGLADYYAFEVRNYFIFQRASPPARKIF